MRKTGKEVKALIRQEWREEIKSERDDKGEKKARIV